MIEYEQIISGEPPVGGDSGLEFTRKINDNFTKTNTGIQTLNNDLTGKINTINNKINLINNKDYYSNYLRDYDGKLIANPTYFYLLEGSWATPDSGYTSIFQGSFRNTYPIYAMYFSNHITGGGSYVTPYFELKITDANNDDVIFASGESYTSGNMVPLKNTTGKHIEPGQAIRIYLGTAGINGGTVTKIYFFLSYSI